MNDDKEISAILDDVESWPSPPRLIKSKRARCRFCQGQASVIHSDSIPRIGICPLCSWELSEVTGKYRARLRARKQYYAILALYHTLHQLGHQVACPGLARHFASFVSH